MRDIVPMQNLGTDHYDTRKLKLSLALCPVFPEKICSIWSNGGKTTKMRKSLICGASLLKFSLFLIFFTRKKLKYTSSFFKRRM